MDRETSWAVIEQQRLAIADLLAGLTPEEWETPSLCANWRVRDVAAHLALTPQPMPVRTLLTAGLRARGNYNRMIDQLTVAYANHPVSELVSQLRRDAASRRLPAPTNYRNILFDVIVHGQDIALPLRRPLPVDSTAVAAATARAARIGRPVWDGHRLDGIRLRATDIDWALGAGREIRGPIMALLLLVTGRTALRDELTGDGLDTMLTRITAHH
ncbi:maleylpyruvate isomerase family mycothiol-dependent enzyme [Nocardia yunnanensis]|uniref:Maleylpyruvate isomerase family mycothiol-dependent enzyme n=1 Tax=Nocardia yunnanensis TaxID=2382165 RepID=A0A386Z9N3_9NOCA|nr:maleylpyruvate isomerase family mycothiol-dependent enzyme [Nocardia yunnanensis]AYF73814.1 maleylpyruvate isomerase family mycothiol-dependent enzyme [Nocardia yunnanensis]